LQKNKKEKRKAEKGETYLAPWARPTRLGRGPAQPQPLSSSPRPPEQAARWRAVSAPTPWPSSRPSPSFSWCHATRRSRRTFSHPSAASSPSSPARSPPQPNNRARRRPSFAWPLAELESATLSNVFPGDDYAKQTHQFGARSSKSDAGFKSSPPAAADLRRGIPHRPAHPRPRRVLRRVQGKHADDFPHPLLVLTHGTRRSPFHWLRPPRPSPLPWPEASRRRPASPRRRGSSRRPRQYPLPPLPCSFPLSGVNSGEPPATGGDPGH
jgi:hypothetical protein